MHQLLKDSPPSERAPWCWPRRSWRPEPGPSVKCLRGSGGARSFIQGLVAQLNAAQSYAEGEGAGPAWPRRSWRPEPGPSVKCLRGSGGARSFIQGLVAQLNAAQLYAEGEGAGPAWPRRSWRSEPGPSVKCPRGSGGACDSFIHRLHAAQSYAGGGVLQAPACV